MTILECLSKINNFLAVPTTLVFFAVAVFLTLKTRFLQVRAIKRFWLLLTMGTKKSTEKSLKTVSPLKALFSAMTTTIGMGNVVGPTMAIAIGGPGALFWLIAYILLGMSVKFVEVVFAIHTRTVTKSGEIIGGPSQYLRLISPQLGLFYAISTTFLFCGWCGLQTNTLAAILSKENVPNWLTGVIASIFVLIIVYGGIKRVGQIASKLIPLVFVLYISYTSMILIKNSNLVLEAIKMVFSYAFAPCAAIGGFLGATLFEALKEGVYKSVFITESGLGTSSIAHAFSNIENPTDQGILAMFSGFANIFLCSLSGLMAIVTGVWNNSSFSSAIVYDAFSKHSPILGKPILLLSVTLFVVTTLVGNTFNGSQSFASIFGYRFINVYYIFAAAITFLGSICQVPLIWAIMDIMLALVALPNIISILFLAIKYPQIIKFR